MASVPNKDAPCDRMMCVVAERLFNQAHIHWAFSLLVDKEAKVSDGRRSVFLTTKNSWE